MMTQIPPPLALYIHLPWCVQKCPYCDFNSHALAPLPQPLCGTASHPSLRSGPALRAVLHPLGWSREGGGVLQEVAYLDALERDLIAALPQVWGREIVSIFIGGGTPSLFSAAGIDRLLTMARTLLRVSPIAEITLEANPGSFETEKFRDFRAAGVNRLSLGVQSFDDAALRRIGRIHNGGEARAAAESARLIFDNLNLDLIYALPGQTEVDLQRDLDAALAIGPDHLSAYHLTLEPNTAFGHTPPSNLPDDDTAAAMQDQIEAALTAAGFGHYETSAYARPHRQARHNLNYWQFGDYLGLGAGAHSKLSLPTGIVRQARVKHPEAYMAALSLCPPHHTQPLCGTASHPSLHSGPALRAVLHPLGWSHEGGGGHYTETPVAPRDLPFEFMMNALRLNGGVEAGLFTERTGLPLLNAAAPLAQARLRGLLEDDPQRLRPTLLGQRFLNDLLTLFLPD